MEVETTTGMEPALLRHARTIYDRLYQQARDDVNRTFNRETLEVDGRAVSDFEELYVGAWTAELEQLVLEGKTNRQVAYMAKMFMEGSGCIEFVRRGSNAYGSIIVLRGRPTHEQWVEAGSPSASTKKSPVSARDQLVKDLQEQVASLTLRLEETARDSNAQWRQVHNRVLELERGFGRVPTDERT